MAQYRLFGAVDDLLDLLVKAREKLLALGRHLQTVVDQCLEQAAGDPEQLLDRGESCLGLQLLEDVHDDTQRLFARRIAQPIEQRGLKRAAQLFGKIAVFRLRQYRSRVGGGRWTYRQIGREKFEFRDGRGIMGGAQLVDQR